MLGNPGPQPHSHTFQFGLQYFSIVKEAKRADGHTCVARKLYDDGDGSVVDCIDGILSKSGGEREAQ